MSLSLRSDKKAIAYKVIWIVFAICSTVLFSFYWDPGLLTYCGKLILDGHITDLYEKLRNNLGTVAMYPILIPLMYAVWNAPLKLFGLELHSVVMCVGISTLLMALFLSIGPMPIERFYTIYSLAEMKDSSREVYTAEEIKEQFISGFVEEANECQKRIDEQVSIGNLEEVDGGIG